MDPVKVDNVIMAVDVKRLMDLAAGYREALFRILGVSESAGNDADVLLKDIQWVRKIAAEALGFEFDEELLP